MLIPSKYAIESGKETPEGTVSMKCSICQKQFTIPAEEAAKDFSLMKSHVCEDCGKEADKIAAVESVNEMKSNDAADTVKTALGN